MTSPAPVPTGRKRALQALLVLAFLGVNGLVWLYAARSVAAGRVVHVVNGTPAPVRFRVDGGSAGEVPARGLAEVTVGEGRHAIELEVAGGSPRTLDVVVETPLARRFAPPPAWVVNAGGAAALLVEEEDYGAGASDRARPPEVRFGEEWLALDVDVAFAPFPEQAEGTLVRRLDVLALSPVEVLSRLPAERRMDWAELHLRLAPDDEALLVAYRDSVEDDELARLSRFLEGGLDRRPVSVLWHRAWQDARRAEGQAAEAEVNARADAALAAEPDSSALHYLRGRLAVGAADALAAYDEALRLDPSNAWASHAKGIVLLGRGELEPGLACCEAACRLRPGDDEMMAMREEGRLLCGQLDVLEADLRRLMTARPRSLGALRRLVDVCAERGDLPAARAAQAEFARAVQAQARGDPERLEALSMAALLEVSGDVAALGSLVESLPATSMARRVHRLGAALAREDARALASAERALAESPPLAPRFTLVASIGAALRGDVAGAERLRLRAAGALDLPSSTARERALAALLRRERPPSLAEVRALPFSASEGAIVLLATACIDLVAGRDLVLAARPLVARGQLFPTRFLRDAAASMLSR